MRMTDFNIVVRPSSSASKEERQVLPDVVALFGVYCARVETKGDHRAENAAAAGTSCKRGVCVAADRDWGCAFEY